MLTVKYVQHLFKQNIALTIKCVNKHCWTRPAKALKSVVFQAESHEKLTNLKQASHSTEIYSF